MLFIPLIPPLAVLLGKMLSGKFILNRMVAGTGSTYYYRKGKRTGLRRYYILAISIYAISWILLIVSFGYIITVLARWLLAKGLLQSLRFW